MSNNKYTSGKYEVKINFNSGPNHKLVYRFYDQNGNKNFKDFIALTQKLFIERYSMSTYYYQHQKEYYEECYKDTDNTIFSAITYFTETNAIDFFYIDDNNIKSNLKISFCEKVIKNIVEKIISNNNIFLRKIFPDQDIKKEICNKITFKYPELSSFGNNDPEKFIKIYNQAVENVTNIKIQKINLYVKGLDGKTSCYYVSNDSTVLEIKKEIEKRLGVYFNTQRLIYSGWQLEDGLTLLNYNITDNATLHLVLKLRGD